MSRWSKIAYSIILIFLISGCEKSAVPGPIESRLNEIQRTYGNPGNIKITEENRKEYISLLQELSDFLSVYEYKDPSDYRNRYSILYKAGIYSSALAWRLGYKKEAGLIYLNSLLINPEQSLKDINQALMADPDSSGFFSQIRIPEYEIKKEQVSENPEGNQYTSEIDIKQGPYNDFNLNAAAGHYLFSRKTKDDNISGLSLILRSPDGYLAKATWSRKDDTIILTR